MPSLEQVPALWTGVSEPAQTDSLPRNDFPDLAGRGSNRSCGLRGTFQNEIAALRMKGEQPLSARHSPAFGGVKVALQTGESDRQAHSDQGDLGCHWEACCAG